LTHSVIPTGLADEMIELRHRIHAHPELGFEEFATSDLVAERLQSWGGTVHRGLGGTGIVAQLTAGDGGKRLGIRADMDALPIHEATGLPYQSRISVKRHACGHDGHTAMLLAAAKHLARERCFSGTLNLIFQPAEEGLGADGLIDGMVPMTGSEDFAFLLEQRPGCYLIVGNGEGEGEGEGEGGCMVHNPGYDFNDAVLPTGASYWVKLAETFLV